MKRIVILMALALMVSVAFGQTVEKLMVKWKAVPGAEYMETPRDSLLAEMVKDEELIAQGLSEKEIAYIKKNLKRMEQVTLELDEAQRKDLDKDIQSLEGYEQLFVVNENNAPEEGSNILQQMWSQVMNPKSQLCAYGKIKKNVAEGVLLRWDIWNKVVMAHLDTKMKVETLSKALSIDGGLVEIERDKDNVVDMKEMVKEVEAGNVLFVIEGKEHPELHSTEEARDYMIAHEIHWNHETWVVGGGVKEKYPNTDKKVVIEYEREGNSNMSDEELKEAIMNCVILLNGEYRPEFHNENEVIKYLSDEEGVLNGEYGVHYHLDEQMAKKYDATKKVVADITFTKSEDKK